MREGIKDWNEMQLNDVLKNCWLWIDFLFTYSHIIHQLIYNIRISNSKKKKNGL